MSNRPASLLVVLLATLAVAACGGADAVQTDAGPGIDAQTPDGSACVPEAVCDFFSGEGCNAEQKCTVISDTPTCGPAGAGEPGTTCTADNQCAAGTVCASYADAKTCMAFCNSANPCGENSACFVRVTTDECNVARVCGQVCNLLDQDCTGKSHGCYPSPSILPGVMEKGICVDTGAVAVGGACQAANDCVLGATCLEDGVCHQLCDRNVDGGCPLETSCQALTGHTATGICK